MRLEPGERLFDDPITELLASPAMLHERDEIRRVSLRHSFRQWLREVVSLPVNFYSDSSLDDMNKEAFQALVNSANRSE